jgi:hypothetical protein
MGGVLINSQSVRILGASGTAVSGAADTNENTLATITIPAGAMGTNGILRITSNWVVTSSANNKTLRVRFSGAAGTVLGSFVATTQPRLKNDALIINTAAATQATSSTWWASAGNAVDVATAPTVDTSAATTIVITGQKATAGETLTLSNYLVELIRP